MSRAACWQNHCECSQIVADCTLMHYYEHVDPTCMFNISNKQMPEIHFVFSMIPIVSAQRRQSNNGLDRSFLLRVTVKLT